MIRPYSIVALFLLVCSSPSLAQPGDNSTESRRASRSDSRMVAYLGNWQSCPTADQVEQYTSIVVAFAVSYIYSEPKNTCDPSCRIEVPPLCANSPNPALIEQWQAAGKKVILSFGGAGMGGSWADSVNDCWDYCFGREEEVVDRLVELVTDMNLDGVDIDYEYFYSNAQPNALARGWTREIEAQRFLREVTLGLRQKLAPGKYVVHAPMDIDIVKGTPYFNILRDVSDSVDYLMPQYYNGVTRPAIDGFNPSSAAAMTGEMSAAVHYADLVNEIFRGDATRVVFGFCINDCPWGNNNAPAGAAAQVIREINNLYSCHGGAFFWVVNDDAGGAWSSLVNEALAVQKGCVDLSLPPVQPPTGIPTLPPGPSSTPSPTVPPRTTRPSNGVIEICCPPGYTGLRAFNQCTSFLNCVNGEELGGLVPCAEGLLFDQTQQACNWANEVTCATDDCIRSTTSTAAPSAPTTELPEERTPRPSSGSITITTTNQPTEPTSTTSAPAVTTQQPTQPPSVATPVPTTFAPRPSNASLTLQSVLFWTVTMAGALLLVIA